MLYFISHPDKEKEVADPGLSELGKIQLLRIEEYFQDRSVDIYPTHILAGTGRRYQEVVNVLKKIFPEAHVRKDPFFGAADSRFVDRFGNLILLTPSGERIPKEEQIDISVLLPQMIMWQQWRKFATARRDILIVSGKREINWHLKLGKSKSGSIYGVDTKGEIVETLLVGGVQRR